MTTVQTVPGTFNQRFEAIVRRFPERTAFRLKTPQGYTAVSYFEAHRQARGVALGLLASGLKSGDRAAVLSENRPEWVVAYLGIYLAGMIAVPLDAQLSPGEWRRLLDDSEARTIFVSSLMLPKLQQAIADSRSQCRVISFDPLPGNQGPRGELTGFIDWATGLHNLPALPECRPSDIVTIIYTSGTTGVPKGVTLTQSNIMSELRSILHAIRADENDVFLCLLPLQHVLASVINVLVPLYLGGQVVFADTLKRSEILEALEDAGITILATVPQFFYLFYNRIQEELSKKSPPARKLFRAMLALNRFSMQFLRINLGKRFFSRIHRSFGSSLRLFVSGGSAFDPKVAQDFHDMGFLIIQGYGLTETAGACTVTRVENNVIGSVGSPLPDVEVKILSPDETGTGEILIRGPIVMNGYYKNPAATEEVIKEGWFHTGDLGRLDAGKNLFITGRKKEVIVLPNGKNIYPDEIEAHYLQCPYVLEIAVIGISSPRERGERLHAVVVPNFDNLKAKKIANSRDILRDKIGTLSTLLPKYKRLMSYQIQGEPLPRTTTRKLKRLEIKKLVENSRSQPAENGAPPAAAIRPEDAALLESAVGLEVLHCLRETYHRNVPIDPAMNLELDLSFDSMERVELLAGLEQSFNLELPEGFGAELHTIRDLIVRLEQQVGVTAPSGTASRQSWKTILAAESPAQEDLPRISGCALSLFKYLCMRLIYYILFKPLLRLETRGLEHLPEKGPFMICPNHQSFLDPFVLLPALPYHIFRKIFFVGYSEFFVSRHMKLAARLANVVPVDPDAHLLRAMKAGAAGLREGFILCIFPEGGRSFDEELQEFKKGAAILARELSVPIVPASIQGAHQAWPRASMRIRPHKVVVRFGSPLMPAESGSADPYQADTDRLRAAVALLLRK
jgi:long-chain acyl-CoA synthetase